MTILGRPISFMEVVCSEGEVPRTPKGCFKNKLVGGFYTWTERAKPCAEDVACIYDDTCKTLPFGGGPTPVNRSRVRTAEKRTSYKLRYQGTSWGRELQQVHYFWRFARVVIAGH
jgi:hypothetical protein